MHVVAHPILARVAYANVVLVMLVAILARHVALDPACVEQRQLALVWHPEPIVMRQTMYANARQPLINAQLERNALEEHVSVST